MNVITVITVWSKLSRRFSRSVTKTKGNQWMTVI